MDEGFKLPFIITTSAFIYKSDLHSVNAGLFLFYEKILGRPSLNEYKGPFTTRKITTTILVSLNTQLLKHKKFKKLIEVKLKSNKIFIGNFKLNEN